MKISKNKIKSLVAEAMKKTILKEVKANTWEEYVNVGKSEADKQKRRRLWAMWELWTKPTQVQVELSYAKSLPVNPAEYAADYSGWVNWYIDVTKNKEAMSAMGRTKNFNVDDHFKYVEKYFPNAAKDPTMQIAKMKADQQTVSNFINGLGFDKKPEAVALDFLDKSKEKAAALAAIDEMLKDLPIKIQDDSLKTSIANVKSGSTLYLFRDPKIDTIFTNDPEGMLELMIGSDVDKLANADSFYRLALHHAIKSDSSLDQKQKQELVEFINRIGLTKPDKAGLASSSKYKEIKDSSKEAVANSALFKAIETSSGVAGEEKKQSNESKMMNENRIRAIIRHELIQAMKS
jgi:hypothetical protein